MRNDMQCPYCGADQEVCHDDGFGYGENERHEQECSECGKNFVFSTYITFSFEPSKADCLNGSDHRLRMSKTFPKQYARMECRDCDYRRDPTEAEWMAEWSEAFPKSTDFIDAYTKVKQ